MADTNTACTQTISKCFICDLLMFPKSTGWVEFMPSIAVRTVRLFAVYFIYKTESSFVCLITFKLAYLWANSIYLNSIKKRESKKHETQRESEKERVQTKSGPFHAMAHGYNLYVYSLVAVELSVYFFLPMFDEKTKLMKILLIESSLNYFSLIYLFISLCIHLFFLKHEKCEREMLKLLNIGWLCKVYQEKCALSFSSVVWCDNRTTTNNHPFVRRFVRPSNASVTRNKISILNSWHVWMFSKAKVLCVFWPQNVCNSFH